MAVADLAVYMHQPYPYWVKGRVCLLGDAGEFDWHTVVTALIEQHTP